jgi:hypothetical protein
VFRNDASDAGGGSNHGHRQQQQQQQRRQQQEQDQQEQRASAAASPLAQHRHVFVKMGEQVQTPALWNCISVCVYSRAAGAARPA